MVDSVNSIGNSELYKAGSIDSTYDFNKDGKVDIEDYNYALQKIVEADDDKYEGYTKNDLDEVFSSLKTKAGTEQSDVTEENAEELAQGIINSVSAGENNPENAKTLNQLQTMGLALTKQIEQSAVILQILEAKIKVQDEELKEIEKEKEAKEAEYANKEKQVESKSEELSAKVIETLRAATNLSAQQEQKADATIKQCVDDYAHGKYPDRTLQEVIASNLFDDAFNVSYLNNEIKNNEFLGREINNLCADIDDIVCDIKSVTEKYNAKNTERNTTNNLISGITAAATQANQQYQSGYERRLKMREEIINNYHVTGTGGVTDENPQVQKLGEFLDNKELDNMPFADAWAILTQTFDQCGIKYNENTGAISIPYGHNAGAKNIYSALKDALTKNYKNMVSQYEEEEGYEDDEQPDTGGVTDIQRTDPITFTNGDIKYDFIKDKNNNGVLDDATEFVGAKTGWAEMKEYDKDGDGKISGDELKNVTLAATNQTNGQFNFISAADAGIESIDLESFKSVNKKEVNKDITVGTFEIKMTDGQTITGKQTEDTNRNIANSYSTMFGSKIEDRTTAYDDNPFMEDFQETTNTDLVTSTSDEAVKSAALNSENILEIGKSNVKQKITAGTIGGELGKAKFDKEIAEKEKKAKAKEEKAQEAKAQEEKAQEEKAQEAKAQEAKEQEAKAKDKKK